MKLHFILVEPARAANVGASARALKTMGFDALRLVGSSKHEESEANWLAHGSNDLLRQTTSYSTIAEAIADCDLVIGTTARIRRIRRPYHGPTNLRRALTNKGSSIQQVAILFGCEESGLSNQQLSYCHLVSSIPQAVKYPSLNLSQAVMIYAYELSPFNDLKPTKPLDFDQHQFRALKEKSNTLLEKLGITHNRKLVAWVNDRLGLLAERDIKMMHTLTNELLNKL